MIDLFISISDAESTDNQFILSTHSPIFINNKTVVNALRVFKNKNNSSEIVQIQSKNLGTTKDLLHIINTHNNQKIFFADKVLLVEGVHDRIVFEKLMQHLNKNSTEIIEVVEVHSKNNLVKYRKFLDTFKIQHFSCADRDYLIEVGNPIVKKMFSSDLKGINEKIIKSKKSKDRKSLTLKLDEAIQKGDLKELKIVWEYIKSRVVKFKQPLNRTEQKDFEKNIKELREKENILILKNGEIEDYLPSGFKQLDQTLELVRDKEFSKWIGSESNHVRDLIEIAKYVINY